MSISDSLEGIKSSSRGLALISLRDKSDEEIRSMFKHNAIIAKGQNIYEAARALGEMEACNIILERRQQKEEKAYQLMEAIDNAKENEWVEQLNTRRMKAVLNIPNATSYLGQLVVSILTEEEGLNAESIRNWADELKTLDDKTYEKLLSGLVDEGVLDVDHGKYCVLNVVTEDLFPAEATAWAKKILLKKNIVLSEKEEALLAHLEATKQPVSEMDFVELFGDAFTKKNMKDRPDQPYGRPALCKLCDYGVLNRTKVKNTQFSLYYFPMIGEKENAK